MNSDSPAHRPKTPTIVPKTTMNLHDLEIHTIKTKQLLIQMPTTNLNLTQLTFSMPNLTMNMINIILTVNHLIILSVDNLKQV